MKNKQFLAVLLAFLVCVSLSTKAFASSVVTIDAVGLSKYGLCSYGDRAGGQYVDKLIGGIGENYSYIRNKVYTTGSTFSNKVYKSDVLSANRNPSTLFVYAGHGVILSSSTNAFHINDNTNNANHSTFSGGEKSSSSPVNVKTTELANTNHQYMIAYTCNFLANGGSTEKQKNIYRIGARVLCGFASTMYLDSREGLYCGQLMGSQSVRSAFINAARKYQPYIGEGSSVIARAVGLSSANVERINSGNSLAPKYDNSPSSYTILQDATIVGKG